MSLETKIATVKYRKRRGLFLFIAIVWIVVVGIGFMALYKYEFKAGTTDYLAEQWPKETSIPWNPNMYQLIMFAHPQCPCTKASLGELELIMAQGQGKVSASVLFSKPKQFDEEWTRSDLFQKAGKIPGVRVLIDDQSQQAKLFGGTTSGQTFLYDRQGQLVFAGGITSSRGHSGDNEGRSAIVNLINHKPTSVSRTPFFGCLLYDRQTQKDNTRRF